MKGRIANRNTFFSIVFCLALSLLLQRQVVCQSSGRQQNQETSCSNATLPPGLEKRLAVDFVSWRIQKPSDLSPSANARWASADYNSCPGIAAGEFRGKDRQSFAILLVPQERPNSAYRLVFYTAPNESFQEEFAVVEKGDAVTASNLFLHGNRIDELFDAASQSKLHISAKDSVLLFEAGENEYEVDAYYWADGAYHSSPVDM